MDDDVFYSLSTEDIQNVANDLFGRNLTEAEIKEVIPLIEDRMNWYDCIEDCILEVVDDEIIDI